MEFFIDYDSLKYNLINCIKDLFNNRIIAEEVYDSIINYLDKHLERLSSEELIDKFYEMKDNWKEVYSE